MEPIADQGAPVAESPTAPATPDVTPHLETWSKEQRDTFWKSGEAPAGVLPSVPASPDDQGASTDAAVKEPASETGKPAQHGKKNVKTRNAEVEAEIAELNKKLEIRRALREELASTAQPKQDARPDPSPAAKLADWERYRKHPDAPKLEDFDAPGRGYDDWMAAMSVFVADQRLSERETRQQAERSTQARRAEHARIATTAREQWEKARAADPEFDSKVDQRLLDITPAFLLPPGQPVQPVNALSAELVRSEVFPELWLFFSTDDGRKEWTELRTLGARDPLAMLRKFGRIEGRFARAEAAPEPVPPPSTVSTAPAPVPTVGRRASTPADPIKAALAAGDYTTYERLANEADRKSRR